MRTVYIDSDFKCHVTDDGTMTPKETEFFDGKCDAYIEGYRYIPAGESWTDNKGTVYTGEMLSPFKDYSTLEQAQKTYEAQQLMQRIAALEESNAALKEENAMLLECVLEMSETVYA